MLATVGADFFAGASDIPVPTQDDGPIDDAPVIDEPAQPDTIDDPAIGDGSSEGAEDTSQVLDAQPPEGVNPEPATTTEDLPDGVTKGKNSKGKEQYYLDPNRYKTVYGNHQLVQQATELLGEPLTTEALALRNEGYLANERLFNSLASGDPASQAEVLNFMVNEMKTAQADGETGVDPTIPFAETVYSTLRDQAPDAYAHLRLQAARDLIGEMYENASRSNNPSLFSAAQHFAATVAGVGPKPADMTADQYAAHVRDVAGRIGIPFYSLQEMQGLAQGEDPMAALTRENALLKSQVNGRQTNTAAERLQNWQTDHIKDVNSAVFNDAVQPALAPIADQWKDFPDDYRALVVDRLNSEVTKAVRDDQNLNAQVKDLNARAARATNPAVRQQLGDQIKQLFVNRAKLATEKAKGPILKFAAEALGRRSAQTNGRRTAAQTRTAPQGQGTPVTRSVLPDMGFKNGMYDSGTAVKQAMAVLNGGR